MKQKQTIRIIFLAIWILMGTYPIARAQNLTGYVYDGNVGDTSTPISGVTVTLYVSNNAGDLGDYRDHATTGVNGSYSLNASGASFDYYNIVETQPTGYTDVDAQSAGGTVKTSNHIQHVGLGGTLTGNNFWDKLLAPTISISDESGNENCGSMGFTVTLSAASASNVTVGYQTNDGTAVSPAVSPNDYTSTSGTLTIPASSKTGTISVTIIDDTIFESTETFTVYLRNATNATISDNQGIGTILDNDDPAGAVFDFGDVPVPYEQNVRCTVDSTFFMGQSSDPEFSAQDDPHALGDDNDGNDDEDGVVLNTPIKPGQTATLDVTITNASMTAPRLQIWIDFNRNYVWDLSEKIVDDNPTGNTTTFTRTYTYTVPGTVSPGFYFVHADLYNQGVIMGTPHGEIEDHEIEVEGEGEEPGEPGGIKWTQPPLLMHIMELDTVVYFGWRETSMHIMPMAADDWFCYDPRPVTDIRWWGAYADWDTIVPPPNAPAEFNIGIWTDVPRGVDREWSHPGDMIHEWVVDRSTLNETAKRAVLMFDPEGENRMITGFEYHFEIPPDGWFHQENDSTVYWLSIAAIYPGEPDTTHWGWLTREHYFHDDAVRFYPEEPVFIGVPFGSGEVVEERWDFSFELGTNVYVREFDYGDAPEMEYSTLLENNGAHHRIVPGIFLGETVDEDADGQPLTGALGDDNDGQDDEDGVRFTETLTIGDVNEVTVFVSAFGFLNAWLDIDRDGGWVEPYDHILRNVELHAGEHTLPIHITEDAEPGETMVRFRFSTEPDLWFNGFAMNGEVEDYAVTLQSGTSVHHQTEAVPSEFMIYSNYPNPFNPVTSITFAMPIKGFISLEVFSIHGKKLTTLIDGVKGAGLHKVQWNGKDDSGQLVSSGIYLCKMKASGFQRTIRMLLLK